MSSSVQERLRNALSQQAEATKTSPDGWNRIRARIDRNPGVRSLSFGRWAVWAPVAAMALVVVTVLAGLAGPERDGSVQVSGGGTRMYLAPTSVEGRFRLVAAGGDPQGPLPGGIFRAYGRRAPDGIALEAAVVVNVPADFALVGAIPEPTPLRALGREVSVAGDDFGRRILSWTQADGRSVAAMTYGLSQGELVALAESLLAGDATKDAPSLPVGFVPVLDGILPEGPPVLSHSTWQSQDGAQFFVNVSEYPGVTLDHLAWWLPGGRAAELRGTTGIFAERREGDLIWIERPGTVVSMHSTRMSPSELLTIAEGLRVLDGAEWRQLVARVPASGGGGLQPSGPDLRDPRRPGPSRLLTAENSYFLLRPVQGRSAPPCPAGPSGPMAPVVAEKVDGNEVACLQVGPPGLDADDVATASARLDRSGGRWEVEFALTTEGASRLSALRRDADPDGQVAILVDGQVVSVPKLADGPTTRGIVPGLDEASARRLADRLRR
jgi:hypothetical protein